MKTRRPHVAHNSGYNDWHTPAAFVEAARNVMGGIDCDPASSALANQTVRATRYFTAEQNGLIQAVWGARVWMNPPYTRGLLETFIAELMRRYRIGEVRQAVALVNNATETAWCQTLLAGASAVCLLHRRIRFNAPGGKASKQPLQGQLVAYLGAETETFARVFAAFGVIGNLVHIAGHDARLSRLRGVPPLFSLLAESPPPFVETGS